MKDDRNWSKKDLGEGLAGVAASLIAAGIFALFARNSSNNAHEQNTQVLRANITALDRAIIELREQINTLRAQNCDFAVQIARGRALIERIEREFSQNRNDHDQLRSHIETLRNEIRHAESNLGNRNNP
jgi:chromosome segregation ATPase